MIGIPPGVRILIAMQPVDFRRGADSLAVLAKEALQQDPFSGTVLVFRAKRAERGVMVGAVAMSMSPDEFGRFMREDIEKWARVVKISGAKADR